MASRLFPDNGSRYVLRKNGDQLANGLIVYYLDAAGQNRAPVYVDRGTDDPDDGDALDGSQTHLDAFGGQVAFRGPRDGTDTLWATVDGGPIFRVTAVPEPRLQDLESALADLQPGGAAEAATVEALDAVAQVAASAETPSGAQAKATAARDAAIAAAAADATAKANAVTSAAAAAAAVAAGPAAEAAALSVAGPAVQTARRLAMADRALLGSGGWYVKRRNVDEWHLMRDVGDGMVADHQLVRAIFPIANTGPALGPASEPRPMLLNDIGIAIPMLPVTFDNATYSGSGWATLPAYFNGTTAPLWLGLDAAFPTVTTTSGSTTITITSAALLPGLRYNARRIVIPGAGVAGADLVTAVGSMAGNGLSFTVTTAPSTTVSGVTAQIYPGRRSTNTATAAATWTAPVGATSVGLVHGTGGNGGFATVSIDGDLTRATYLPTAQQLVDEGIAPSSMLTTGGGTVLPTTRILDSYNAIELWSVWQGLASGLSASSAHTVVVTITEYKRTASTGTRLIVGGFGYGTVSTGPTTATAVPFLAYRCGKSTPVHELALDHQPSGTSSHTFVGGHNHGYEFETQALTLTVDGAPVTLVDDQAVAVASTATLVRRSDLYHPQNTTTATMRARYTYRMDKSGLTMNALIEAPVATVVDSVYFGSFTAPYTLPRVQPDLAATAYNLLTGPAEGEYVGAGKNTAVAWWQPSGPAAAVVLVPTAQAQTGNWSSTPVASGVRNFPTTSQTSKWYARRTGNMAAGARWAGEVTYIIGYLPDGASGYFPVA